MDKQLLDSLNNLSQSLESLVDALSKKKEAKSGTATALTGGDFGKQLTQISASIQEIKSDNKKILKNTETILQFAKEKQTNSITDAGDPKQKSAIKQGVGMLLLIAGGVLAIGVAFRLIGAVDFKSVIALSLAIPLLGISFMSLAKGLKGVPMTTLLLMPIILGALSFAVMISSRYLSQVQPVTPQQGFTAVAIAGVFTIISYGMGKVAQSIKGIGLLSILVMPFALSALSYAMMKSSEFLSKVQPITITQALTSIAIAGVFTILSYGIAKIAKGLNGFGLAAVAIMPIVLGALSYAIMKSSEFLSQVKPIRLDQALTSIAIALIFTVTSYGIARIVKGLNGVGLAAVVLMPIVLGALSFAILKSSEFLSQVKPITISQALTSIGIALVFTTISYGIGRLVQGLNKVGLAAIVIMPIMLVAISYAIERSSHILAKTEPIEFKTLGSIVLLSLALSISSLVLGFTFDLLGRMSLKNIAVGGMAAIVISAGLMASSWVLSLGNYTNAPDPKYALAFGLSLLLVTPAIVLLGIAGLPIVAMGSIGLVMAATALMISSHILSKANFKIFYKIADAAEYFAKKIVNVIGYGMKVIMPIIGNFIKQFGSVIVDFAKNILPVITKAVGQLMKEVLIPLGEFIKQIVPIIGDFFDKILKDILPTVNIIIQSLSGIVDSVTGLIGAIATGIEKVGQQITNIIGSVSNIITAIGSSIGRVVDSISNSVDKMASGVSRVIDAIGNSAVKMGSGIKMTIDAVVGGVERLSKVGYYDLGKSAANIVKFLGSIAKSVNQFKSIDATALNNLVQIADSYDRLSESVGDLSNSITTLDVDKLMALRSLTGNIVLMSLMDPDQFGRMMDTMDQKASKFVKMMDILDSDGNKSTPATVTVTTHGGVSSGKTDTQILNDKMDKLVGIMADISSVVGSNGTLKEYLEGLHREHKIGGSNVYGIN